MSGDGRTISERTWGADAIAELAVAIEGAGRTINVRTFGDDPLGLPGFGYGVKVPTGSFRRVHVELYDRNGDPLTEAEWVQSAGVFPTSARVNGNGEADMWLLNTAYDSFVALAPAGREGLGYVWYTIDTESDVIGADTTDAKLVFEKKELTGFDAGQGVDMGGNLNA